MFVAFAKIIRPQGITCHCGAAEKLARSSKVNEHEQGFNEQRQQLVYYLKFYTTIFRFLIWS